MKKKYFIILVLLILILHSPVVSSHNIFIEVPMHATQGEELTFKSFFSHPYEPIEDRDMTTMEMKVRLPDGNIQDVDMDQKETYYQTNWEFTEKGEFVFILEREPYQYFRTEIRDYGKSIVWVDKKMQDHKNLGLPLEISLLSSADEISESDRLEFKILLAEETLYDAELLVHKSFEPAGRLYDYDHNKEGIQPDGEGVFSTELDRGYNYILEADYEISANKAEELFDISTSSLTNKVRYRSTLFLPVR